MSMFFTLPAVGRFESHLCAHRAALGTYSTKAPSPSGSPSASDVLVVGLMICPATESSWSASSHFLHHVSQSRIA